MSDQKNRDEITEELSKIEEASSHFIFKRMLLWTIRWTIGFSIIGIVVHFYRNLSWLWWVGIAFASLTPITTLIARRYMKRKLMEVQGKLQELDNALGEEEV